MTWLGCKGSSFTSYMCLINKIDLSHLRVASHVFETRYNNLSLTSDLHELDMWRRATG